TVETGRFGLDGGAMFGVVPKPLWSRKIPADERNRIPLAMRCLLLEDGDRLILIDNGIGDKFDDKFTNIYNVSFSGSSLKQSMSDLGFGLDDVTDVVITHLHFDHCGGSTVKTPHGLEVAFPNARFHVQLKHWAAANAPNVRERASFLRENIEPLAESGQLSFVDGDEEIFPGVSAITVDGHTDHMQLVKISDEETTLVFAADLLPTRFHLAPAWTMAYDIRPLVSMEEKSRFLRRAVDNGWHLFFEHDPEVEVASVAVGEKGPEVVDTRILKEL
ncbi:MAG: MBL fold metallo-hydrolase, partial [Rhodothermia bacterium]|nr:MBL fold metallo-hydrolase [Rhodothermia bacterium]